MSGPEYRFEERLRINDLIEKASVLLEKIENEEMVLETEAVLPYKMGIVKLKTIIRFPKKDAV